MENETFGRGTEGRVWGSDSFKCHSKFISECPQQGISVFSIIAGATREN